MSIDIILVIFFTASVQSIFGTGVLLFGTPLLLILGYKFQYILIILLPTSILINLFQLRNNLGKIHIRFYKRLLVYSIPLIITFLYLTESFAFKIDVIIGVFLVIISQKETILSINRFMKRLIKYENIYLMIMGIIHGITNLGGALLSAIVFSKNLTKEGKRTTIAACYLTFAIFQLSTIIIFFENNNIVFGSNLIYWALGPAIFFIVERYIYFKIRETTYINYSNLFLLVMGLMLVIKN
ncbi:MAG: hypothetical protein CMG71_01610 [Candidatus Marinimicrobia bacterium]|nr:hypothetical protein [Candidatus Neomarinimicrobiota bacterium]|tara:strand:+ start:4402 stop:5121 length:720 start_codon:yes stop_codon:yes gene_type:complete